MLFIITTLLAALTTALVYGLGGVLAIDGALQIGTLVAVVTLLPQLYGPINQLSNMQANVMVALVSFDRVFEVLDLRPLVDEHPGARALPGDASAPDVEFDQVSFHYPASSGRPASGVGRRCRPADQPLNRLETSRSVDDVPYPG